MNIDETTKAIGTLARSKDRHKFPAMFLLAGIFIGIQYVEFKTRLQRIEEKLSKIENLEQRIAKLEDKK